MVDIFLGIKKSGRKKKVIYPHGFTYQGIAYTFIQSGKVSIGYSRLVYGALYRREGNLDSVSRLMVCLDTRSKTVMLTRRGTVIKSENPNIKKYLPNSEWYFANDSTLRFKTHDGIEYGHTKF